MSEILLINKSELAKCVPLDTGAIDCVENAFRILAGGEVIMPPILQLVMEDNDAEVCVKTAFLPGVESFAIKISPGFFNNYKYGLPSGSGMMNLFNSQTGILEAVLLDQGYLTDVRTAAAGAVAARWLARDNASRVAVIGAGVQAELQLKAIALVRDIEGATVWARDPAKADAFAVRLSADLQIPVEPHSTISETVSGADIIVTTTPASEALVSFTDLVPGQTVIAMGSDSERKFELDPAMIPKVDRYICDSLAQVRILGELHHAIDQGFVNEDTDFDELGDVVAGKCSGRVGDTEIIICDLTGTGAQDTAIATMARSRALHADLGSRISS